MLEVLKNLEKVKEDKKDTEDSRTEENDIYRKKL